MTTQTEISQRNYRRAVQFFWSFLIGATVVSLVGNIAHAVLPYLPTVVIQVGAAAVPPIALLAAVHGIALAVRAGASGSVYCWAVAAIAAIGAGAFTVSFLTLRDLMLAIGYSTATSCAFPAIIDTAVAVSTLMLVALGDKPAGRRSTMSRTASAQTSAVQRLSQGAAKTAKRHVTPFASSNTRAHAAPPSHAQHVASIQADGPQTTPSAHADTTAVDADLASDLIASGVTTQSVDTVVAVISAYRDGASINAAAKGSGINYRTAQRIVEAADRRHRQLVAAS